MNKIYKCEPTLEELYKIRNKLDIVNEKNKIYAINVQINRHENE